MRGVFLGDEDDDWFEDEDREPIYPDLTLEVDGPTVLGYLLSADGEIGWTLLDRPMVPFGFTSQRTEDT